MAPAVFKDKKGFSVMKKIALLISALMLCICVASCGGKGDVTTSNPELADIATSVSESLKMASDFEGDIKKLDEDTVKTYEDTVKTLEDLAAKLVKASNSVDQDTIDEYKSTAQQSSTVLMSILSKTTDDTTTEYKEYGKDDANADIKNEIISLAKEISKTRMDVKEKVTGDAKTVFDEKTEALYNLEQTIHNKLDDMTEDELNELRDNANELKAAFEALK